MLKLKNIATIGLAAALMSGAAAAPSMAQVYRHYDRGYDNYNRGYSNLTSSYVDSLEWRINNAAQERRISYGEARNLLRDLRSIQGPTIYRIETGRASNWEVRRVQNVVDRIETATQRYARNGVYPRYGYNRRY